MADGKIQFYSKRKNFAGRRRSRRLKPKPSHNYSILQTYTLFIFKKDIRNSSQFSVGLQRFAVSYRSQTEAFSNCNLL